MISRACGNPDMIHRKSGMLNVALKMLDCQPLNIPGIKI